MGRDWPQDRAHPADRPDHGPRGLPGARLQRQHPHGRVGPHPQGEPLGADPAGPRRGAEHPAAVHRVRPAVHLLAAGPPRPDPARLRPAGHCRHVPLRHPRSHARHGGRAADRADAAPGRRRRDHRRADLHDLRRARRRFLRRPGRPDGGLPGHRPRVRQGPGRPADPGARAYPDPGHPGPARRGEAPGAALALHDRAVPADLPGRRGPRRVGPARGVRVAGQRHLAAERPAHRGQPAGTRAHRGHRRPAAGRRGRLLHPAGPGGVAASPARRRSTTRRSCGTRWRAAS